MRFIHTADWHLGKLFGQRHMTEDQAYVLDELIALCDDLRPDALVIAGDIYDRAIPPPEAVAEEQPARTATAAREASPSLSFRIFVFGSSAVSLSEVSVQDPAPAVRG